MTGPDSMADPTAQHAPGWRDIRTIGPLLLVVFGLVLAFTPMASVGVTGSVGNAGVADKGEQGCPTQAQLDFMIEQRLAYEASLEDPDLNWLGGSPLSLAEIEALLAICSCDATYGGNAGNAGIVDPCDRQDAATTTTVSPPVTEPPTTEPPTTEPTATEPPATDPVPTPTPTAAPPTDTDDAASPVPAPAGQLPSTGNGGPIGTATVGFLLAAFGILLLVTARRRPITP